MFEQKYGLFVLFVLCVGKLFEKQRFSFLFVPCGDIFLKQIRRSRNRAIEQWLDRAPEQACPVRNTDKEFIMTQTEQIH